MIDMGFLGIGILDSASGRIPVLLVCRNGSTLASAAPTGTPTYVVENSAGTQVESGNFPSSDHQSRTGHRFVTITPTTGTYSSGETYTVTCTYVVSGTTFHSVGKFMVS